MLVLRTALRDHATWQTSTCWLSIAVNISPRSLLDPEFVDEVAWTLADCSVRPGEQIHGSKLPAGREGPDLVGGIAARVSL